jgi:hypothetical protein
MDLRNRHESTVGTTHFAEKMENSAKKQQTAFINAVAMRENS